MKIFIFFQKFKRNKTQSVPGLKELFLKHKVILIILMGAFAMQVIYWIFFNPPISWQDAGVYDTLAWNLAQGNGYSLTPPIPSASREPGYPLFLALFYWLFGHRFWPIQMIQMILHLTSVFLVYRLGQNFIAKPIGLLAAFLFAIHPSLIIYNFEILTECLFTFTLLLSIYCLLASLKQKHSLFFLVAAFSGSISAIIRFNAIFLFIPLSFIIYGFTRSLKKTLGYLSLSVSILILLLFPWIIRNYFCFFTFIPSRIGGGAIVWAGSYPPWDGDWKENPPTFFQLSPQLSELEKDRFFYQKTKENLKNNPLKVAHLWLKKPFKIILPAEGASYLSSAKLGSYSNLNFLYRHPLVSKIIQITLQGYHYLLLAAAIGGAIALWKKKRWLVIAFLTVIGYFLSTYLPLNALPRYLTPLWPYLFLLAAAGLLSFKKNPS